MCVCGPHFTLRCQCVYMVFTLPSGVNVCMRSSLYLQMCIARLEHPTCLATYSVDMPASSMPIARWRKLLGILGILKILQCEKKVNFLNTFLSVFVHLTSMSVT